MKRLFIFFSISALLLSGCGQAETIYTGESTAAGETGLLAASAVQAETEMFTDRDYDADYDESESVLIDLNGSTASCNSGAVRISGSTVTITGEGTYILSGSLENGTVIVDADKADKLRLVLDNAAIYSESSAAIYIRQADKVFITLAENSENRLSNGGAFQALDGNNIDGVIFSKDDLTLNGSGSLSIDSPAGHGIVSKDDLAITGGSYEFSGIGHGLSGKDSVRIADGEFTIVSGKDAVHAENTEDSDLGFIYISGGTFTLQAGGDGLSASGRLQIESGCFSILSGGGSSNAAKKSRGNGLFPLKAEESAPDDGTSTKGIKAGGSLVLSGGSFIIDSADDALHSNSDLSLSGGSFSIAAGDDGMHADGQLAISGGSVDIITSFEGIEGLCILISGGEISLVSSDDGLNAAGGRDQSGFGGPGGGDTFVSGGECYISISGGRLNISADGDGIDSNGSLSVSGGEIYISGPTDGANGALDYETEALISGGVLVAVGASQMAQGFSSGSTQGVIMATTGSQAGGSRITLADEAGTVLTAWQAGKGFDCVIVSCPGIAADGRYTLSAGSYTESIAMDGLIYGALGMAPMGGGPGRGGMEAPPDGGVPDTGMPEGIQGGGGPDGAPFGGFEGERPMK